METGLREGLHFCFSGPIPVFLDLGTGRYFSLAATPAATFRALCNEGGAGVSQNALQALRDIGLFAAGNTLPQPIPLQAAPATSEFMRDGPMGLVQGARAALQLLAARRLLRKHGIKAMFQSLCAEKDRLAPAHAVAPEKLTHILDAFGVLTSTFSGQDMCLPNSAALLRALVRSRVSANLVLGVRTPPFAAHCWVQAGSTVLNDRIDNVRLFTPIASV